MAELEEAETKIDFSTWKVVEHFKTKVEETSISVLDIVEWNINESKKVRESSNFKVLSELERKSKNEKLMKNWIIRYDYDKILNIMPLEKVQKYISLLDQYLVKKVYDTISVHILKQGKDIKIEFSKYLDNLYLLIKNKHEIFQGYKKPEPRFSRWMTMIEEWETELLDLNKLKELWIDPNYIIVWRITDYWKTKPERFWTTDIHQISWFINESWDPTKKNIYLTTLVDILDDKYWWLGKDILDTDQLTFMQLKEQKFDKTNLIWEYSYLELFKK